jgi:hypothetical protein
LIKLDPLGIPSVYEKRHKIPPTVCPTFEKNTEIHHEDQDEWLPLSSFFGTEAFEAQTFWESRFIMSQFLTGYRLTEYEDIADALLRIVYECVDMVVQFEGNETEEIIQNQMERLQHFVSRVCFCICVEDKLLLLHACMADVKSFIQSPINHDLCDKFLAAMHEFLAKEIEMVRA